jgi:TorA maturation chaperone TorD
LKEHLFEWAEEHCELIREKTENNLIIGISYILQGLMEVERKQLNVRRRSKK